MKRSIIMFILLGSFIGWVFWYGDTLPEKSKVSMSQSFMHSEKEIRELIFNFQLYPKWRENVYAVKKIPSRNNYHAWQETDGDGRTTTYQLLEFKQDGAATEISIDVMGKKLQSLGHLHFKIVGHDDPPSSELTITRDKPIPNRISRAVDKLLSQGTGNINAYFSSISNKFTSDMRREKKHPTSQKNIIKPTPPDTAPAATGGVPAPGASTGTSTGSTTKTKTTSP
ncbi:MAG TPA: hypothetical protein ENJ08_01665 [Gammaproteobacteria bacterium]|nr:hypothetical protein [Gammaproteobacteria bacterium]